MAKAAFKPQELGIGWLFYSMRDAVIAADASTQRIVLWNPSAATIFGYSEEEAVGMALEELVPEELKDRHRAGISRFASGETGPLIEAGEPVELPALAKGGRAIYVELTLTPVPTSRPGGPYVLAILRDVTGRRRSEEALRDRTALSESLMQTLAQAGEGVVIADSQTFEILWVNRAASAIFGYRPEDMLRLPSELSLIAPDHQHAIETRVRERERDVVDHYDTVGVRKDGARIELEVAAKFLDERRTIALFRDVTERKRLESFRRNFIANAAHELRTPTTTVMGMAEILKGWRDLPEGRVDQIVAAVAGQSARLASLLRNLVDLALAEAGSLTVEPVPLRQALLGAVDDSSPPPEKPVAVDVDDGIAVLADEPKLRQSVSNLLTNAYRYGGERVWVEAEPEDDHVKIAVCDNGAGLPDDLVPEVFEPFTRGRTHQIAGSGLGLAIVRTAVEAMGGSVQYEPATTAGARFVLTLRRPAGQAADALPSE